MNETTGGIAATDVTQRMQGDSHCGRRDFLGLMGGTFAAGLLAEEMALSKPALAGDATPVLETVSGKVRGYSSGKVKIFKGVPYGASTAGPGRFMPPQKAVSWSGVRDTLDFGLRCPQMQEELIPEFSIMNRREAMGEDCLCLNVWTPGLNDGVKRPVMVWFHGGGYATGAGSVDTYDGTNLAAKHGAVVVTVNHRLNIFGFLYLAGLGQEKYAATSNLGMLDIIQSLEWVRDNIEKFGGDPATVTVFGQSGGGGKVTALLSMPKAKGLFHRAICMSGSLVRGVTPEEATAGTKALLARLELRPDQLDKLQEMPHLQLYPYAYGLNGGPTPLNPPLRLQPVVDGRTLPAHPFDPTASTISADVPVMIGSTETEITWGTQTFFDPLTEAELLARVKESVKGDDAKAARVVATYRKGRPQASNLDLWLIIATDNSNFRQGGEIQSLRRAELQRGPVYKYYFQWYSPVREGILRATHLVDVPFAFDNIERGKTLVGTGVTQQKLADQMSAAFVAFAKTGNPNHRGIPTWPVFTAQQRATMVWNTENKVVNNPYGEERASLVS